VNIELRPLVPADAETSVRWRNDPAIWTYTGAVGRGPIDVATERAWIERVMMDPGERRYAIVADGAYIGNAYLTDIADKKAQFHIFIGERDRWGQGLGRRTTAAVLELAWQELDLNDVYLLVHRSNDAAISLYRTLGFAAVGPEGDFERMAIANPHRKRT
jgi:RimJ/RimL family protein N-acetyltransferase